MVQLGDTVDFAGIDYQVDGFCDYCLGDRTLRLARLRGATQVRYLEPAASEIANRVLLLVEVDNLDLSTPPPHTLYHGGESYLLRVSGTGEAQVKGESDGLPSGPCAVWRYRAAGDQFLQIERWPNRIRTLAGPSVDRSMLEVRPANQESRK